jgi:hypothetical protein
MGFLKVDEYVKTGRFYRRCRMWASSNGARDTASATSTHSSHATALATPNIRAGREQAPFDIPYEYSTKAVSLIDAQPIRFSGKRPPRRRVKIGFECSCYAHAKQMHNGT